jgi:toxin ParE1/3/4
MPRAVLSEAARRDLVEHFVYLAEQAGLQVAERSMESAESSLELLATQTLMGAPLTMRRSELAGLRKWRVDGFDKVLIFYLPRADGISVVRVLHATRDWWHLLGLQD